MENDERPETWDDLPSYEKRNTAVAWFERPPTPTLASEWLNSAAVIASHVEDLYADVKGLTWEVSYDRLEFKREFTAEEKADRLKAAQKNWDSKVRVVERSEPVSEAVLKEIRQVSEDNARRAELADAPEA